MDREEHRALIRKLTDQIQGEVSKDKIRVISERDRIIRGQFKQIEKEKGIER